MVEVGRELWRSSGPTLVLTGISEASEMHFYVPRNNFQKWPRKNNLKMVGLELQKGMGESPTCITKTPSCKNKQTNLSSCLLFTCNYRYNRKEISFEAKIPYFVIERKSRWIFTPDDQ